MIPQASGACRRRARARQRGTAGVVNDGLVRSIAAFGRASVTACILLSAMQRVALGELLRIIGEEARGPGDFERWDTRRFDSGRYRALGRCHPPI